MKYSRISRISIGYEKTMRIAFVRTKGNPAKKGRMEKNVEEIGSELLCLMQNKSIADELWKRARKETIRKFSFIAPNSRIIKGRWVRTTKDLIII